MRACSKNLTKTVLMSCPFAFGGNTRIARDMSVSVSELSMPKTISQHTTRGVLKQNMISFMCDDDRDKTSRRERGCMRVEDTLMRTNGYGWGLGKSKTTDMLFFVSETHNRHTLVVVRCGAVRWSRENGFVYQYASAENGQISNHVFRCCAAENIRYGNFMARVAGEDSNMGTRNRGLEHAMVRGLRAWSGEVMVGYYLLRFEIRNSKFECRIQSKWFATTQHVWPIHEHSWILCQRDVVFSWGLKGSFVYFKWSEISLLMFIFYLVQYWLIPYFRSPYVLALDLDLSIS